MLATAVILAFAISALGAPAEPAGCGVGSRRRGIAQLDTKRSRLAASSAAASRAWTQANPSGGRRCVSRPSNDFLGTPRTASTSTDGRYEFRDVAPGRYTLRVERSGYLALAYGQRRPGEQGRPLEIAETEVAEKVDFALPRMSVISGRVLDDLGEPIAGVTVWVLQTRFVQGRRQLVATGANASTDITGRYRLLSLPPGDYAVMGTTRATWPHDSDPKQVFGYAPTYFPGTSTAAQAQRVKLGVAQEASGIDFNLAAGRTSSVRGHATSASGFPLGGETVTMVHEIGGPTMWMGSAVAVASTKVAGDGSWTLSNIPPGEYRLSIRAAARGNDPAQEGQVTISVAGVDVEGLSLVAGAGGTVRGEVVTDDGSPLPAGFDRMQVRPPFNPSARMMVSVLHPDNGRVQSDGSFAVEGVLSDTVPFHWPVDRRVDAQGHRGRRARYRRPSAASRARQDAVGRPRRAHQPADDHPRHVARREADSCGRDRDCLRGRQCEVARGLTHAPGDTPRSAGIVHVQGAAGGRLLSGCARRRPGGPMVRP